MSDLAWRLWRRGYLAVPEDRTARGGAPTYVTRLLGRRTVVLSGVEGARLFYQDELVRRADAVPPPVGHLLFGRGAVHSTDDTKHARRKALFVDPLHGPSIDELAEAAGRRLEQALAGGAGEPVSLHRAAVEAYGVSVLEWAGVPLPPDGPDRPDGPAVARDLARIVAGFGGQPVPYARGWAARRRTDAWMRGLVRAERAGEGVARPDSFLARVAASDLSDRLAAVELGNVLRPTVAVAWLAVGAASALHHHPAAADRILEGDVDLARSLVHEVRRTTPFVPLLAGRARRDFRAPDGVRVGPDDRLVLDVRGTHLREDVHADARAFDPERFLGGDPGPFEVLAQGGGDLGGHRCPGERLTVTLLVHTVDVLARCGAVPVGDVSVDLRRAPALPPHGLPVRTGRIPDPQRGTGGVHRR